MTSLKILCFFAILPSSLIQAQIDPKPENATAAVIQAFQTHNIVMVGEFHGNRQEYDWLRSLVATPEFADKVDDIVVEVGNALYQKSVDRYVSGEDVPIDQVAGAWRNTVGLIGPPSPVYESLYNSVRETNLGRKGKHQLRVVCGDPPIDWSKVTERQDLDPYLADRDQFYARVVKNEVLDKHHRALLIMGWGHFLRNFLPGQGKSFIERQLLSADAKTFLIVAGTNTAAGYDDLDARFTSWKKPAIVDLTNNWVGDLPAMPVISGGGGLPMKLHIVSASGADMSLPPLKLKDAADALLYLGPRDSLTQLFMSPSEVEGTAYGKEIARRLAVVGVPYVLSDKTEGPQFSRPSPPTGASIPQPPVKRIINNTQPAPH